MKLVEKKESTTDDTDDTDVPLPTAQELSDRFGAGFKKYISRFKESIKLEISSALTASDTPLLLTHLGEKIAAIIDTAKSSIPYIQDSISDKTKQVSLEMSRIDIRIDDQTIEKAEKENPTNGMPPNANFEKSYYIINGNAYRGIIEEGVVPNPGFGDKWIEIFIEDYHNNRELTIRFKVYLQVPKG